MICQNWWQNGFKFKQTRPPLHSYSSPNICRAFTPHVVAHLAKRYETKPNKKVLALIPKSGNQDIWYHLHHILIPQNDFRRMLCVRYSTAPLLEKSIVANKSKEGSKSTEQGAASIAVVDRNSMNVEAFGIRWRSVTNQYVKIETKTRGMHFLPWRKKNKQYVHLTDVVKWYCKLKCCKQTSTNKTLRNM